MSSHYEQVRQLVERFEQQPVVLALRARFDFPAAMVVETDGTVDYLEAKEFVFSKSEMSGRVRPQTNFRDDIVLWFFEDENDAILFALKFASSLPRRLHPCG